MGRFRVILGLAVEDKLVDLARRVPDVMNCKSGDSLAFSSDWWS